MAALPARHVEALRTICTHATRTQHKQHTGCGPQKLHNNCEVLVQPRRHSCALLPTLLLDSRTAVLDMFLCTESFVPGAWQETLDGDLAARVFAVLRLADEGLHAAGRYGERSRQRLDVALLHFLQCFRKVYIGEQVRWSGPRPGAGRGRSRGESGVDLGQWLRRPRRTVYIGIGEQVSGAGAR